MAQDFRTGNFYEIVVHVISPVFDYLKKLIGINVLKTNLLLTKLIVLKICAPEIVDHPRL